LAEALARLAALGGIEVRAMVLAAKFHELRQSQPAG